MIKVRHVLRDNIHGLTKRRIRNMCLVAYDLNLRLPENAYDWIRSHVYLPIMEWQAGRIIAYTKLFKRHTVLSDAIQYVFTGNKSIEQDSPFIFAVIKFQRWIREVCQDFQNDLRFSKQAVLQWQHHFEQESTEALKRCDFQHLILKRNMVTHEWLVHQTEVIRHQLKFDERDMQRVMFSSTHFNIELIVVTALLIPLLKHARALSDLLLLKHVNESCMGAAMTMVLQGKLLHQMRHTTNINNTSNEVVTISDRERTIVSFYIQQDVEKGMTPKATMFAEKFVHGIYKNLSNIVKDQSDKVDALNASDDFVAALTNSPVEIAVV